MSRTSVDIVIPVYNEEHVLRGSVGTLLDFCRNHLQHDFVVTVADNGSTDATRDVARELATTEDEVNLLEIDQKGRGYALSRAWQESDADLRAYMDVDLSTNLLSLPPLLDSLTHGYDVAIGSRLLKSAHTTRSAQREILSRGYNMIIKLCFQTKFSDAQCGFKAITRRVAEETLPLIRDRKWFFDTELLVTAEKMGYQIYEVPVNWIEDLDTRVELMKTVRDDLVGIAKLRRDIGRRVRGGPVVRSQGESDLEADQRRV